MVHIGKIPKNKNPTKFVWHYFESNEPYMSAWSREKNVLLTANDAFDI